VIEFDAGSGKVGAHGWTCAACGMYACAM
jgi:hypothetical protein